MKKLLILALILSSTLTYADQAPAPFVVTPDNIRKQLLSKNISLLQSLNGVEAAKINVNNARANLFPSINLAVLLPALANPTFLLASVNYLFPFLVPANWAIVKQEKDLFEADKAAYKATELNILSNAYSLYHTHLTDLEVQSIYNDQAAILEKIYSNLKLQARVFNNVPDEDLSMALAQLNEAKIASSKIQELIIAEKANLRTMLALPVGTELQITPSDVISSSFEDKSIQEVIDRSMSSAPEVNQLIFLEKAAMAGKFSKELGAITQTSIGGTTTSQTPAMSNLKPGVSFNFGLSNITSVELANKNISSIKLGQEQLKEQTEKTAEILIGQLLEIKSQLNFSTEALHERLAVYEAQKFQYKLGVVSEQTLLQTQSQLINAKVSLAKSQLDYRLKKIALSRLVIDGDFAKVQGCNPNADMTKKSFHIPGFGKGKAQSLDVVCRQ